MKRLGRWSTTSVVWPLVAALLLLALGCRRTPQKAPTPQIHLGVVEVGPAAGLPPPSLDTGALAQQLRDRLLRSGLFAGLAGPGSPPTQPVAKVRVEIAAQEVSAAGKVALRAAVRFRLAVRPEGSAPAHVFENVQGVAETTLPASPGDARQEALARLVGRLIDDLAAAYVSRQQLWGGDPSLVQAALRDGRGERRIEAIRAVAGRGLTAEAGTLLRLLGDDDELTRDAALGALVALRERRAVAELTRSRSMRDTREMRKIIGAIATLGGDEAVDYLGFVAEAHEDEEVRAMAQTALARLGKGPTPSPAPSRK